MYMCLYIYIYTFFAVFAYCFSTLSTFRNEFVDFLYKILLSRSGRFRKGRRDCLIAEILLRKVYRLIKFSKQLRKQH